MNVSDNRLHLIGNFHVYNWNKKLCWESRDTFFECVEKTDNGNKYRCPDQLYAYEMWCPPDFRRIESQKKSKEDIDSQMYDAEWVNRINKEKQTIKSGHY